MTALDRLVPNPRLVEIDRVDLAAPAAGVWDLVRHGDLAQSAVIRALFAIRTVVNRSKTKRRAPAVLRLDDLTSSPDRPGFQVLAEDPGREVAVAAIGQVWRLDIPFRHMASADEYCAFTEPGFIKVAWAIRVSPRGEHGTRLEFEVRVDATDNESWRKFRWYFRVVGPASRFIRRSILRTLARKCAVAAGGEDDRPLPGDELLADANAQITHHVDIAATPQTIWPWLVQMGGRRAGFYSIDLLDNGGVRSAREIHPELQQLVVGDVIPATPEGPDGFEVLRVHDSTALVLGGLFDAAAHQQLPFAAARPPRYWHVTWAFVLEPLDQHTTRLHVRARAAFSASERLHAAWIRPVHHIMQRAQLRNLAARVEKRMRPDGWRDVLQGIVGVSLIAIALLTPFRRRRRTHWGLSTEVADRPLPGDDFVGGPRWSWTHGIEIDASAEQVWPWVAQIGANRGGFYSYQWLENLAGCRLRNAETVHPEWQVFEGQGLLVHPEMHALRIVSLERGRHFVAYARPDQAAREDGKPWVAASWLFLVEPLGANRCRFVSRYRVAYSNDIVTRLSFGPTFAEPIGSTMDRRMLIAVKQRVERSRRLAVAA
jgi:hypothetical protein